MVINVGITLGGNFKIKATVFAERFKVSSIWVSLVLR
jgi:hypothetical protein